MKIIKGWLIGILVMGLVMVLAGQSLAVPAMINMQGRLIDKSSGNPIEGSRIMVFTFWDAANGGNQLPAGTPWGEVHSDGVLLDKGLFNVVLGSVRAIPSEVFLGDEVYLQISIQEDGEVFDRQKMVAVPFAFMTENLKGGSVDAKGNPAVKGESQRDPAFKGYLGRDPGSIYKAGVMGEAGSSTTGHLALRAEEGPTYYGVRGFAYQSGATNYGVYGEGATAGVKGKSSGGDGVYGESTSGYGVHGKSISSKPSFGYLGDSNYGVYGRYHDGTNNRSRGYLGSSAYGAYGQYHNGASFRSFGYLGGSEYGAYGCYSNGTRLLSSGYLGGSDHGVYGEYRKSDGSFGPYGYVGGGLYGVKGYSAEENGAGGYFESTDGYGVYGATNASDQAGVYAQNTGDGPALEVGDGWIKTQKGHIAAAVDSGTVVICNGHAGIVEMVGDGGLNLENDYVIIKNDKVRDGSIILATLRLVNPSSNASDLGGLAVSNVSYLYQAGSLVGFNVHLDGDIPEGPPDNRVRVAVQFLVLN